MSIKRFNRNELTVFKVDEIGNFRKDLMHVDDEDRDTIKRLENYIYGLYDGYYYEVILNDGITMLRNLGYKGLSIRLGYIVDGIKKCTLTDVPTEIIID